MLKGAILGIFLSILSFPFWSRIWYRIARISRPRFVVESVIKWYQRHYRIDMSQFKGTPEDYETLADFFIRELDPKARPLIKDERYLLSPADSRVVNVELIHGDGATQVKGWTYSVNELLGDELNFARGYWVVTLYLSPSDYHRFHFPTRGRIVERRKLGARLYPVAPFSLNSVKNLFLENEREVLKIDTANFSYFFVAVGATFVGSIEIERSEGEQLDELGYFAMGSTIVLVIPADAVGEPAVRPGDKVIVGERLFEIRGDWNV